MCTKISPACGDCAIKEFCKKGKRINQNNVSSKCPITYNKDKAETIICQCEYGQSRSAAIAAALSEFFWKSGIDIFADDRYFPNKLVFRLTLQALNERGQDYA